ncbi:MAG: ATP-binding protein [Tsuneonella sp.]
MSAASMSPESARTKFDIDWRRFLLTALVLAISAAAASWAAHAYGDVAAALIFVLGITVAGALCGLASALLASLAAFLIYNFYLTEPALSFRLATGRDLAPLIIFNLCGLVAGVLAGRLKDYTEAARSSNRQLGNLLGLSRALQSAARIQDVADTLGKVAYELVGIQLALFRVSPQGLEIVGSLPASAAWQMLATQALTSETQTIAEGGLVATRLEDSDGLQGVMIIELCGQVRLDPTFIDALRNLAVLAMQRAVLSEEIAERRAAMRAEELKTALLGSVSHDFRTPLTAISASASSLITYREELDAPTSARLLQGIVDECERLNRYTANLLELSRLEADIVPVGVTTLSVAELIGSAITRVRARAGRRTIERADGNDVLVNANAALFELVLVNVLDNAIIYSDDATLISISIDLDNDRCRLVVADQGYGIPKDDLHRVFERFHRVSRAEPAPRGSGLGLAIAKGFVEALDGKIEAQVPGIGQVGARIIISLPVAEKVPPL